MTRLFLLLLALPYVLVAQPLQVDISAKNAILINGYTGEVLFEKNADESCYPASVAKIATALCLLEEKGERLDEVITASHDAIAAISSEQKIKANYATPSHWLEFGSNHIGLKKGEQVSLETLLYGLMLSSGNDAANAIAIAVGGDVPNFTSRINRRLKELGCDRSNFTNPHGLHHPDQVTSAKDMARVMQVAMAHPKFREVVGTVVADRPATNLQEADKFYQFNRLVKKGKWHHPHVLGGKTGTTVAAGCNLVAAADDGDRYLIAAVMGCEKDVHRYEDATKLFNAAFGEEKQVKVLMKKGVQPLSHKVIKGRGKLKTALEQDLIWSYYPSEEVPIKGEVQWHELHAPIMAGTEVATVALMDDRGNVLQSAPLLAVNDVKLGGLSRINRKWKFLVLVGAFTLLAAVVVRKKR